MLALYCFLLILFQSSHSLKVTPITKRLNTVYPNITLPQNLIPVPLYRQQTTFSCGPSSALSILRYWNWEKYNNVTEQELYKPMNCTPEDGADPIPITNYLRYVAGLDAQYIYGKSITLDFLENEVRNKSPPIVDLQAWTDDGNVNWNTDWIDGHYNVLVGYDSQNFYFMDPSTDDTYAYISKSEFFSRWHDLVGVTNTKTYHMVILIRGNNNYPVHPINPVFPYAQYED